VLRRASEGRLLAGVAAGLAEHLGLAPIVLRAAFVLLTMAGGIGIALYGAFWVFVPQGEGPSVVSGRARGQLLALVAIGVGAVLLLHRIGLLHGHRGLFPLGAVVVGIALVWRQADEAQRYRWRATAGGPGGLARAAGGAVLLIAGLAGFLATRGELGAAREGLVSTAVVVTGLVVLTAPFWRGMTNDLRAERRERIRSQERAEVAAHVHDSVLQTLALIQKAADDPREVTRLARGQERELRGWLYRPAGDPQLTFAAALEQAAAEVEESHRTPVEVVVVGDCPAETRLGALVAAAREAMVNAAKHSGADQVRVYAEVEEDRVTVYVRDRGVGFDPAAVEPDRFGLAESVVGRMQRNDGTVEVRSTPGEGTEVKLEVARG
jgi:signal transduction histidine kinase/phage shock protein PspC (stress-responsive transcriptional regulator)